MTEASFDFQKKKKVLKFLSESDSDKIWNMHVLVLGYSRFVAERFK